MHSTFGDFDSIILILSDPSSSFYREDVINTEGTDKCLFCKNFKALNAEVLRFYYNKKDMDCWC
jgi:hypothetical protein